MKIIKVSEATGIGMTKLEELKAAYEASTQGEWEQVGYNDLGRHVQTPEAGEICALKRGKWKQIRNDEYKANANFIALAHKFMPTMLEAVELLRTATVIIKDEYPESDERYEVVVSANALLEKLK